MNALTFSFSLIRKHRTVFIIFCIAAILRIATLYVSLLVYHGSYNHLTLDGYYEIANNLIHHGVFSRSSVPPFLPDSLRTPGMPLLLYPFLMLGNGLFVIIFLQIIVASVLPVIGRKLGIMIGLSPKLATAVALVMALDPFSIELSLKIMTDTFFTFFFLLFVFFTVRVIQTHAQGNEHQNLKAAAVAGICIGIATLFRPTTLYLPLVVSIVALIAWRTVNMRHRLHFVALFLAAAYVLVLPWMYRNYHIFNHFAFSSIKAEVMYTALAPAVVSIATNQDYRAVRQSFFAAEGTDTFPDIQLDRAREMEKKASALIAPYPLALMKVAMISSLTFFTHDGMVNFLGVIGQGPVMTSLPHTTDLVRRPLMETLQKIMAVAASPLVFILAVRLLWTSVTLIFFVSILYLIFVKKMSQPRIFLTFCIFYFTLTTISNGFAVNARFRFPVNALILIIAAIGIQSFRTRLKKHADPIHNHPRI